MIPGDLRSENAENGLEYEFSSPCDHPLIQ